MNFKEIKNDVIAEFDYRRKGYHPTFYGFSPIVGAIFSWCLAMTMFLSMMIGQREFVEASQLTSAAMLVVGAVMVGASVINCIQWDVINAVLYSAESLTVWLGFLIATRIPVAETEIGSILYTTILCVFIGGGFGLATYILGRKLIDGRDKR